MTKIKDHEKWMKLAFREAETAFEQNEVPVGAVLVDLKTNKLISKSGNKVVCKSNPLAHAELEVISDGLGFYNKKYYQFILNKYQDLKIENLLIMILIMFQKLF